jgi:hypothetical protein
MLRFIYFLNNSNLLVALAAACTCAHAYLICDYSVPVMEVSLVFFLTWCAYLFLKPSDSSFHKIRITLGATGVLVSLLFVDIRFVFLCLLAMPLVLFYNAQGVATWFQNYIRFTLRTNGWFKIIATALAWTLITSCPLFIDGDITFISHHAHMVYCNFFFIAALVVAGDLRDMEIDRGKLLTVPVVKGENFSRLLVVIFMLLSTLAGAIAAAQFSQAMMYSLIAFQAFALVCIWPFSSNKNWHLQTLVLDGLLIARFIVAFAVAVEYGLPQ